jgi:5-methylthioadenosine/S-adenosylhomocysteine deaminase
LKRRLHFHCSETKREHEECIARHGKTPIAYLAETGILDNGGYAAHCVWCTDDDFRIMAEHDVSLVHNPTSNMKLGSGFARIVRAMELGVNVALGTDGTASNDNLDMFEEMHLASLIHKGLAQDPTVLSPWDVIEMATVNGAKALGRDDIGEIAVGKFADLCVVDLDKPHLTPALDMANLVVHSMHASDVVMTFVDGDSVYDKARVGAEFDGVHQGFAKAKADLLAAVKRLI